MLARYLGPVARDNFVRAKYSRARVAVPNMFSALNVRARLDLQAVGEQPSAAGPVNKAHLQYL